MKWSFDRVLTLWRSHPRLLALAFTKQVALEMRHESRALLVWRRWSRASIVLEDAVYELVGQRERRLRAEALQPAVHRWRLRTQRELASAALETRFLWRSSASRAMLRRRNSSKNTHTRRRNGFHTPSEVPRTNLWNLDISAEDIGFRDWFRGAPRALARGSSPSKSASRKIMVSERFEHGSKAAPREVNSRTPPNV